MLNFLSARVSNLFDKVPPATLSSTAFLLVVGAALGFGLPLGLDHPYDWAFHGVFFALLTVSLSGFFQGRALPAFVIALLLAAGGEIIQGKLGYREMSAADFAASMIGALSAAGVLSIRVPAPFPAEELSFIERARADRGLRD
ncbi:hypothetical protein C8N35_11277 [Breoghania corrubedonensis]|uniref:VanZ like protein n=1 Tax=Breoghania corrubedonensis TaxID=665038 RepID=A0A2T5UW95_9HYPH|nr:hypothetical protein [Breoghania corrubedonensis]PTW55752.1 hypothetical protein C8N35_11277 [Breoghania corrubedonensis]